MWKVCLIGSLFMLVLTSKAQRISDTVNIYIDERIEMKFVLDNYAELKDDSTKAVVSAFLTDFQKHLPELSKEMDVNASELLRYQDDDKIILRAREEKEVFMLSNDGLKNSGPRDKAILLHPKVRIEISAADLSEAVDVPFAKYFEEMVDSLPQKVRNSRVLTYSVKNDSLEAIIDKMDWKPTGDELEITFGAGANFYKGKWLGEFQTRMDLVFFEKNVLKHNPYVSYSWLYDFSRFDRVNINGFLNLGYQWDLARGKEEESRSGVEAGFLINRNGNLFEPKTWRVGLNWEAGDGISVSPQMYVVGGFEKVQPGIRISFGL